MWTPIRACALISILAISAAAPATAQFPPSPENTQTTADPKAKKGAAPAGPDITGSWTGELNQIGSQSPYQFELVINAKGAQTRYPGLECTGRLTRVGSSRTYAFFVEVITKGQVDKGGRCPDGTITVTRQGDDLALGWFGSVQGNTIVAYGTLKKK